MSLFPHRLHGAPSNDYSTTFFHHLGKVDSWIQQEEFEAALTNSAWKKREAALRITCDKQGYERYSLLPCTIWQIPTSQNKVLLFNAAMAAMGNDNLEVTFHFLVFPEWQRRTLDKSQDKN